MILSSLNLALTRLQPQGNPLVSQALAVLGLYGADAHLYIPGVGTVNGITAGNFLDPAGTTPATLNGQVGRVNDATGSIVVTEATNKPTLRQSSGLYSWQFDGTNDILNLDSVPFAMADDHLIVMGVNLSTLGSVDPFVICDSANTLGGLVKLGFSGSGNFFYALRDNAGLPPIFNAGTVATVNTTNIMSGRKSGVDSELRVNAQPQASSTLAVVGPTTLDRASIGARNTSGGTTNMVNGFIYPVIAIKGTVTDANRLVLEKFVGLLSGVTI